MRPDSTLLSAYLDGEVPEKYAGEIARAIRTDDSVRADYEALAGLQARLRADDPVDVEASARRSWDRIQARLEREPAVAAHGGVWSRRVAVPVPMLAAAATVVIALGGILLSVLLPGSDPTDYYLSGTNDVDVTIRVDGAEMDEVLQWLVDKNMLGEISIQLPEQRFQIVGEPVFVKPAPHRGEVVQ